MRTSDIIGYGLLAGAFVFYYFDDFRTGSFLNSMAVGVFLGSLFNQYREHKALKKVRIKVENEEEFRKHMDDKDRQ